MIKKIGDFLDDSIRETPRLWALLIGWCLSPVVQALLR